MSRIFDLAPENPGASSMEALPNPVGPIMELLLCSANVRSMKNHTLRALNSHFVIPINRYRYSGS